MKARRKELGLTMKELGEKMRITESNVCAIEKGTRQMPMDLSVAQKLADALEYSLQQVVALEVGYEKED